MLAVRPRTHFHRPPNSDATEPPEARGLARDAVRLLVARSSGVSHARFADLGDYLQAGDLLVVNNSATLAAAVDGRRAGNLIAIHFCTALADQLWVVELRPDGNATGHLTDVRPGERIDMPGGGAIVIGSSYPRAGIDGARLWTARVAVEGLGGSVVSYLARYGRPIRYSYVPRQWPLHYYQTVFARHLGSAEMPSAARPFTTELVTALVADGIAIAPITLHAGVSSAQLGEPPVAELYAVGPATARLVNLTHAAGGRVVAVGTTVTRALESAASADGLVQPAVGWTNLVLGAGRPRRVVDGLITGWHEAGASHLMLLEAVAGQDLVATAYREAVEQGYLWHEFGDSALLLPAVGCH
ncbi:S-adenosylmethionine:tRNA ribosyltransferase-isomerase [Mycobacterium haemophilum]|uniref:Queuosine biosynthesis protein n=1 Tax=Mycobacterium haemophilum TaxID=29311 RepID=A0A0I9U390_9MYCO|nr:S-adenosylmethionine:tRNA ribosyltransferase-isomerase [Mycobacterium haemophilum]KLO32134.1 queuosine biosynthesis protein [Mycobacterium haemophilum]KLO36541.1 queuosine biosynthesis protein [Mycobacterium haemophilum]KLO42467.1 queuosine biosynthesis protein [Mycobacterium haemophilum]KLO55344.1 queuosine biosynthesis protein [Mycobacterium haemophilum]